MRKKIALDNMILTKDSPTTAGSKMLDGYMSLFDAEVLIRLKDNGFELSEKTSVGEFAIDLIGETANKELDALRTIADALADDETYCAVCLDVNGSVRRIAAQNGFISIKPTYGTVSRYGTIPVACSGETVSVVAKDTEKCKDVLKSIAGHDDKDGTSITSCDYKEENVEVKRVLVIKSMLEGAEDEVLAKLEDVKNILNANNVEICEADDSIISKSRIAWNILMSAELCNNVSRYDGVKYGYRANDFTNIDEMYTNTRTEAFGELLKTAIIFGSETLSTDNYFKVYDKALRVRRVIKEKFDDLFEEYDAVLMPACSKYEYKEELTDKSAPFEENFYTAPASITGLPAIVVGGVQFVGKAFSENVLFEIANMYENGRA